MCQGVLVFLQGHGELRRRLSLPFLGLSFLRIFLSKPSFVETGVSPKYLCIYLNTPYQNKYKQVS